MISAMVRRRLVWLLSLPLMLAGVEAGHWLAFRLVYTNAWERSQALQQSGHGYLSDWRDAAAAGAVLLAAGLVLQVREHVRRQPGQPALPPSARTFAALPPLTFALQEHLESLVHSGTLTGVAVSPTFLVGIALQLPVAAATYLIARLLLRVARIVGRVLGSRPRLPSLAAPLSLHRPVGQRPRARVLAGARLGRGPPVPA